MTVQATDGLDHGSAPDPSLTVIVTLSDVNDNSPMFINFPSVVNVPEVGQCRNYVLSLLLLCVHVHVFW